MIEFKPLDGVDSWRPWIKDVFAAAGLIGFMLASFWAMARLADVVEWVEGWKVTLQ